MDLHITALGVSSNDIMTIVISLVFFKEVVTIGAAAVATDVQLYCFVNLRLWDIAEEIRLCMGISKVHKRHLLATENNNTD